MRLLHKLALAIVLMSLLAMLFPISVAQADEIVTFPDPSLEAAIRQAIGKPTGDIYQSDLDGLTWLDADLRNIASLNGLEHCTSLTNLNLDLNHYISDLSPLSGLASLTSLHLWGNDISDISPLSGLTSLTSLDLVWNRINDISTLSGLTGLTELRLGANGISDLSPLATLTNLTILDISSNGISDITTLSGLSKLWGLDIYNNNISDITPLSGLTSLLTVRAQYNQISDLSPFMGLASLVNLELDRNQISEISALAGLTNLDHLFLGYNQISDITPLSDLANMGALGLDNNQISNISALAGLTNLWYLRLQGNRISDITPLFGLTSLNWYLDLSNNQISDIAPLSNLKSLPRLFLGSNQISDISPLAGLTNLTELYLSDNQINDIEPLVNNSGLSSSDYIDLRDNLLNYTSVYTYIPQLQERGVTVDYDAPLNQAPNQPTNVSPSDGATGISLTPTLQSSTFSDPDAGDTHAASQWQVRTSSGSYSNPVYDSGTDSSHLTQITLSSGVLNGNTTVYYWHVSHQDNHGAWSDWSPETSFATLNRAPNHPSNASPVNGATSISLTPTLQSSTFSDPDAGDTHAASQWQIRTSSGSYSSPVYDSGTDASHLTTITIPSGILSPDTTYYWHVRHQDNHSTWSNYSTETSFTTRITEIVTFPDPNLEAAIREALGKPTGDIYQSDLDGLTTLSAENRGIINLTGLEHCTNLTTLSLYHNLITDISAISNLDQLTNLNLIWNQISDISPLENLTDLIILSLSGNKIRDISFLSNFTDLQVLGLEGNFISDVSAITNLTNLSSLWLGVDEFGHGNAITDLQPLVVNSGLSTGDNISVENNPLNADSIDVYIPQLQSRGVDVDYSTPNTPEGTNVRVDIMSLFQPGVGFGTIHTVSAKGHSVAMFPPPEWWPTLPTGYQSLNAMVMDILTGAVYSGPIDFEGDYSTFESQLTNENGLKIFHWNGNQWEDATTSVDTVNNIIYGRVNSLSLFFFGEPLAVPVATATGSGTATFSSASGTIQNITAISESSLPTEGKPNLNFPHGFFEFQITGLTPGETVTLAITLPSAVPVGTQYWKYGPTPTDPTNHWYQIPMNSNDGDNVIEIPLVDGGLGDDDLAANGVILDQGGPGNPPSPEGGTGVPVFPNVYIGIGAALGAGILAYILRRRLVRQEVRN